VIDAAAFASKNLYNAALYEMRQAFFNDGIYLTYNQMQRRMQSYEAYKALPAKVSQQILMLLDKNWTSFKEAKKAYEEDPVQVHRTATTPQVQAQNRRPEHPCLHRPGGEQKRVEEGTHSTFDAPYRGTNEAQGHSSSSHHPSKWSLCDRGSVQQRASSSEGRPLFCVAIDLGVTNLAAITSNREGWVPRLVNGRPVKAWNQWYNKRMKELKLCLPKEDREHVTKQMEQITNIRNRRINHYLHAASKRIIDFLVKEGVGTAIIGKNPLWKQEVNNGRRNNQNFVSIPHARFIDMLTYKASLVGIQVEIQEESYTSKASFVDLDPIPTYKLNDDTEYIFSGKRIGRRNRLYRTKDGHKICADVNGSYNILRKSKPDAFVNAGAKGIAAYVVQPRRLAITV